MRLSSVGTILIAISTLTACKTQKQPAVENRQLPIIDVFAPEKRVYQASRTLKHDLLHTRLEVSFDWTKEQVIGKAWLDFTPYFYPSDSIVIDAKNFTINSIGIWKNNAAAPLKFSYDDSLQLHIDLDKKYSRTDTFTIFVNYTANPSASYQDESVGIQSDKGLFFINPRNEEPNKPQQIWTQGETENNSRWFPTTDSPNERMTTDIALEIDKKFVSLSNGDLLFSEEKDATRIDHWKMEKPHAPYLVMLAIGEYAVVNDSWKEIEVDYYVEPDYKDDAKAIFGKTPAMLTCFSDKLGVKYPWSKYHQVTGRDYVSGAMENTTAVLFGEFVQKHERELLDGNYDDIVAHELFHHWFGDLVTCESWANLPLNESFATYGEIIWRECGESVESAHAHLHGDLKSYLRESERKKVDMIRYYHDNKESMFDSHSYAKGGRILHMLRDYVGDDAFFAGLQKYLEDNAYQSVEIHNLRLAFEATTGEDLNWFFNQWFLAAGHPELEINYSYLDSSQMVTVTIEQTQKTPAPSVYQLPIAIDIYSNGKASRELVTVSERTSIFNFKVNDQPDLVNVDANKMLLAKIQDNKQNDAYVFQYYNAPMWKDRHEAILACGANTEDSLCKGVIIAAMNDKHWDLRLEALESYDAAFQNFDELVVLPILRKLATDDQKSDVRVRAHQILRKVSDYEREKDRVEAALKDQSFLVLSEGLRGLEWSNRDNLVASIEKYEDTYSKDVKLAIADIYGNEAGPEKYEFFVKLNGDVSKYEKLELIPYFKEYLINGKNDGLIAQSMKIFAQSASQDGAWWMKIGGIESMYSLLDYRQDQADSLQNQVNTAKKQNEPQERLYSLEGNLAKLQNEIGRLELAIENTRDKESDERVLSFYREIKSEDE